MTDRAESVDLEYGAEQYLDSMAQMARREAVRRGRYAVVASGRAAHELDEVDIETGLKLADELERRRIWRIVSIQVITVVSLITVAVVAVLVVWLFFARSGDESTSTGSFVALAAIPVLSCAVLFAATSDGRGLGRGRLGPPYIGKRPRRSTRMDLLLAWDELEKKIVQEGRSSSGNDEASNLSDAIASYANRHSIEVAEITSALAVRNRVVHDKVVLKSEVEAALASLRAIIDAADGGSPPLRSMG